MRASGSVESTWKPRSLCGTCFPSTPSETFKEEAEGRRRGERARVLRISQGLQYPSAFPLLKPHPTLGFLLAPFLPSTAQQQTPTHWRDHRGETVRHAAAAHAVDRFGENALIIEDLVFQLSVKTRVIKTPCTEMWCVAKPHCTPVTSWAQSTPIQQQQNKNILYRPYAVFLERERTQSHQIL